MIGMSVTLDDVDGAWSDLLKLPDDKLIKTLASDMIKIVVLPAGMASGQPSVAMRFDLPDGRVLLAETSARLFCTTARMVQARYPNLFDDTKGGEEESVH